jgi:hypothetical protein
MIREFSHCRCRQTRRQQNSQQAGASLSRRRQRTVAMHLMGRDVAPRFGDEPSYATARRTHRMRGSNLPGIGATS